MSFLDDAKAKKDALKSSAETLKEYNNGLSQDLAQNEYNFRYLVFPNDIGMDDVGHYMVININVPTRIDGETPAGSELVQQQFNLVTPVKRSKVDTIRYDGSGVVVGPVAGSVTNGISMPRYTRRIKESIAVYMPTGIAFQTHNHYTEVSMFDEGNKLIAGAVNNITGSRFASVVQESGQQSISRNFFTGPINPAVEVLFATVSLRRFTMDFLFAPRNLKESENMEEIIKTLRFHAAPEINTRTFGLTWIPPAEFDITFFNKGVENTHIPRINTCVLEYANVSYEPNGIYSTFRNGHPVVASLQLGFRELAPVNKGMILQGF